MLISLRKLKSVISQKGWSEHNNGDIFSPRIVIQPVLVNNDLIRQPVLVNIDIIRHGVEFHQIVASGSGSGLVRVVPLFEYNFSRIWLCACKQISPEW